MLVAAVVLVGLVAAGALALSLLVNKARLQAAASEVLGMDVEVGGRMDVDYFPSLHVKLEDLRVRNRGLDLLLAEQADFKIDFLPLLSREVKFSETTVKGYRLSIERGVDGTFNYEPEDSQRVLPPLDLQGVSFSDGAMHYTDQESGKGFEITGCNLDLSHVGHSGGKPSDLLSRLSITMDFVCAQIQKDQRVATQLQGSLKGNDGVFVFEPLTMLLFGGNASGSVQVDRRGSVPEVHARYSLAKFQIEEFLKTLSPEKVAHGPMDLTVDLTLQGRTWDELRQTAQGDVSLVGENLTLDNRDLDEELARYESSQHFDLVDVGAMFLVGPLGLAVTKGYDFSSLLRGSGGSTPVPTLVSKWEVERGVAHAKDVALTTRENRLAIQGDLDFVHEQFDLTVALVDPGGCPQVRQKIVGPFAKPVLDKPNFLRSVAGPGIKLFKKIRNLFPGKKCEVFYEGSVAPPVRPAKKKS